jgi:hypothetical protein
MSFQPDIIVTTVDGISLVAEAKLALPNFEHTEEDLKKYMVGMQCPVGLLITPDRMWLYRDSSSHNRLSPFSASANSTPDLCGESRRRHKECRSNRLYNVGWRDSPGNQPGNYLWTCARRSGNTSFPQS